MEESHLGTSAMVICGKVRSPAAPRPPGRIERLQRRTLMRKGVRGRRSFEGSHLKPVNAHDFDPAIYLEDFERH